MRPRIVTIMGAILYLCSVSSLAAEAELLTLRKNPFSQPEVVNKPPPPPPAPVAAQIVLPAEEVKLDLSATMVSATNPMVVVDGELLVIGDKIEGLKLIAVMEGSAVFTRGGKKYSFAVDELRER
jgi:hypothetical protein